MALPTLGFLAELRDGRLQADSRNSLQHSLLAWREYGRHAGLSHEEVV